MTWFLQKIKLIYQFCRDYLMEPRLLAKHTWQGLKEKILDWGIIWLVEKERVFVTPNQRQCRNIQFDYSFTSLNFGKFQFLLDAMISIIRAPLQRDRQIPWLSSKSRIGYCSHCERWLGSSINCKNTANAVFSEEDLSRNIWISLTLGELITWSFQA